MSSWKSYPSSYNLGHAAIRDLLTVPVYVEEKVDGSQFSFGVHTNENGDDELLVRSKGTQMVTDAPMKMFQEAVNTAKYLKDVLRPGWTYRTEYLQKPKHNTLAYDRIPEKHLVLFDVSTGDGEFLPRFTLEQEAQRLGLEVVPLLGYFAEGQLTYDILRNLIDNTKSFLGGQLVEGVVIKQIGATGYLYGKDGKVLLGKFVSERFKEAHRVSWGESNPTTGDILLKLQKAYGTPGRWLKSIQHLRDDGKLENSPRDIGPLILEIRKDTGIDCKEEIKKILWKWAWPHIERGITREFPEFYKDHLLKLQFEGSENPQEVAEILLPCEVDGCPNTRYGSKRRCADHLPSTAVQGLPEGVASSVARTEETESVVPSS